MKMATTKANEAKHAMCVAATITQRKKKKKQKRKKK
jgi:hypothetical protein